MEIISTLKAAVGVLIPGVCEVLEKRCERQGNQDRLGLAKAVKWLRNGAYIAAALTVLAAVALMVLKFSNGVIGGVAGLGVIVTLMLTFNAANKAKNIQQLLRANRFVPAEEPR